MAEILHYKTSGCLAAMTVTFCVKHHGETVLVPTPIPGFAWALIAIATHFAFNLLCVAGGVLCTH